MLSRRFLSGAFAAALVMVLGACGTQSEPPQQPRAEQTVRYYFALVFWGYETGDPAPVEALQSPDCEECREFSRRIRKVGQDSDYWQDVHIEDVGIKTYEAENFEHEIGYIFTLSASVGGYDGRDPDGTDYVAVVGIDWVDGEWQIGGLIFEAV